VGSWPSRAFKHFANDNERFAGAADVDAQTDDGIDNVVMRIFRVIDYVPAGASRAPFKRAKL
jgi:hypothetical protein